MKLDLIKKSIKRRAIILLPIVLVSTICIFFANSYSTSNAEKLATSNSRATAMQSQIAAKQEEYANAQKTFTEYKTIIPNKIPSAEKYSTGKDRLKVLLPIIKDMKDIYHFNKLSFSLTEVKNAQVGLGALEVYQNNIDIDFSGASDELVYSFLNDIKILLPGYISVKELSMKREDDLEPSLVFLYMSDPQKSIVSGKMVLQWTVAATMTQNNNNSGMPEGQYNPPSIRN